MSQHVVTRYVRESADAGQQVARLRHVLRLVEQIAGSAPSAGHEDAALDENARISSSYGSAPTIIQRRFDALAAETAAWAACGIEALLTARDDAEPPRAAARALAGELAAALRDLSDLLQA